MSRIGRVALVCGQLDSSDATTYTLNLARGLTSSGTLLRAVGPGGPLAPQLKEAGVELSAFSLLGKSVVGGLAAARAGALIGSFGPKVIHALKPDVWAAARRMVAALKVPLVVTAHDFVEKPTDLPWKQAEQPVVIAASEALRENLVNSGGMAKRQVVVVPMGLDLTGYPPRPPERPPSGSSEWGRDVDVERTVTIGCLAPLEERKGIDVFIKAARNVLDSGKDVEFFIAGAGTMESQLRKLAADIGSRGRMTFLGEDVRPEQLMPNLDVFVLPSLRETLGISLLQAMACSRAVIASASGGIFDVVADGETGYLVPPGDEKALADRMIQLAADSRMRSEMGRAGREKLETDFSIDQMVQQTVAVYLKAIETTGIV